MLTDVKTSYGLYICSPTEALQPALQCAREQRYCVLVMIANVSSQSCIRPIKISNTHFSSQGADAKKPQINVEKLVLGRFQIRLFGWNLLGSELELTKFSDHLLAVKAEKVAWNVAEGVAEGRCKGNFYADHFVQNS